MFWSGSPFLSFPFSPKGTVPRDFWLQFFYMDQFPSSPDYTSRAVIYVGDPAVWNFFYVFQWFHNAKSVFLAVNASLRWLDNVSGVYLVQVSLFLIGQQGLKYFFRYRPLLPIGWRTVQILRQCRRKQPIQRKLLLLQYKQQANPFLSMNNYNPLLISWNDKNKQLTLLSQRKLALTARNTLFALNHWST
jgi:hypothetical protein